MAGWPSSRWYRRPGALQLRHRDALVVDVLAESLGALARDLEQQDDSETMLAAVVAAAVAMVPGAEEGRSACSPPAAGHLRRRRPRSTLRIVAIQEEVQQGPCLDRSMSSKPSGHNRPPRLGGRCSPNGQPPGREHAVAAAVRGRLQPRLPNLFARSPGAFTDESEQVGCWSPPMLPSPTPGPAKNELAQALINRDLIGQAKGILIERYKITATEPSCVDPGRQNSNRNCTTSRRQLRPRWHHLHREQFPGRRATSRGRAAV